MVHGPDAIPERAAGMVDAGPRDRAAANWAYRAALDREQAAASDLESLSQLDATRHSARLGGLA